jgi:hypothetical protein
MQKILAFVLIVLLTLCIGCKKDESSTTSPTTTTTTIPTVTFKGPSSSETHAQTANTYAQSMNGVMSASAAFSALPASTSGNVSTWSYSYGGLTETFTGKKQSDGSYTWTWVFNGSDGTHTYNNWTFWSGTTSADGKTGSWSFYEYGTTHSVEDLNYTTVNGVLSGTWLIYNTSGVVASKIVIINNTDNSGEFDWYYDGTTLYEKVTWTASGTGTWATYNPVGSGTF